MWSPPGCGRSLWVGHNGQLPQPAVQRLPLAHCYLLRDTSLHEDAHEDPDVCRTSWEKVDTAEPCFQPQHEAERPVRPKKQTRNCGLQSGVIRWSGAGEQVALS